MFKEIIDESYIINQSGTSEGTQVKYYKKGFWYKKDNRGREGYVEYLVSKLLSYSSLKEDEFVMYEYGVINNVNGCRSKNFLKSDESLITLYRLYYNEYGTNIAEEISKIEKMEDRIEYIIHFVKKICGIDIYDYLAKLIAIDMLVLNEDRHFNNIALINNENGFVPAPIFDNGVSLLTANVSVNWNFSVEENVRRVIAKPFSGSHEKMYKYFNNKLNINYEKALLWIDSEPDSKEKEVLKYQLKKYEENFKQN